MSASWFRMAAVAAAIALLCAASPLTTASAGATTASSATMIVPAAAGLDGVFGVSGTYSIDPADGACYLSLAYSQPGSVSANPTISAAAVTGSGAFNYTATRATFAPKQAAPISVQLHATCPNGTTFDQTLARASVAVPALYAAPVYPAYFPSADTRPDTKITQSLITDPTAQVVVALYRGSQLLKRVATLATRNVLTYPISRATAAGKYEMRTTVTAKGAAPFVRSSWPVIARGWVAMNRLDNPYAIVTYPKCSKVTWRIDSAAIPRGVSAGLLERDVRTAFAAFAPATGLHFVEVTGKAAATVVIRWGRISSSGEGGSDWSDSDDQYDSGDVTLSITNWWPRVPGFPSSAVEPNARSGRGPLLLHEIGHVVGLGHVVEESHLMHGVALAGKTSTRLTSDEITGLRTMYQPQTCAK